jgi:hypothetical protein
MGHYSLSKYAVGDIIGFQSITKHIHFGIVTATETNYVFVKFFDERLGTYGYSTNTPNIYNLMNKGK